MTTTKTPNADLHPRPQLTRPRWTNLSGPWGFAYDDGDVGLREGWPERADVFDRTIQVPFPPESRASGIGDTGFHPVVWYRRTFSVSEDEWGDRLILHLGAVDYRARVWVNGRLVAEHEGGSTPFSADVTAALHDGDESEQTIVVRAEDDPTDLTQPRGKQGWFSEPRRIWYHRTTGIWQPVWLEPLPAVSIDELRWTPDIVRGMLGLSARLSSTPKTPLQLRVRLSLHGQPICDDTYEMAGADLRREVSLDLGRLAMDRNETLWSPRFPNLVDAELTLLDGDRVVDQVRSYAGLRTCGVADGRFLLNGQAHYPRLVLAQGYWPESHLAAPGPDALRREVELVKALGFNGVRIHQKIEDPRFLHWCDRLGLLVWGELPSAYVFGPDTVERLTREWMEVLRRDYSHPCIVTWVPMNESWGVPNLPDDPAQRAFVQAIHSLTRALDPTRPVIGNDGWEHVASDIWGIHDYAPDAATLTARYDSEEAVAATIRTVRPSYRAIVLGDQSRDGRPVMLTEFGGLSDLQDPDQRWVAYGSVEGKEALLRQYEELVSAVLDSPALAGFCYTQLTDTEQETNGLLTADRRSKLDVAAVHAINTRPSAAVPGELISNIQTSQLETIPDAGAGE